ncbi:MAG: hypothetical protein RMK92_03965 [Armatimonadota bacterium]|nr:hypothetical protein [Armatimonadota bacterium]
MHPEEQYHYAIVERAHVPASEEPREPSAAETEEASPPASAEASTPSDGSEQPEPLHTEPAIESLNGLVEPYPFAAPFWHLPLEPGVYHETPLLVHAHLKDAEHIVSRMEEYLRDQGYEVRANQLRLEYTRLVKIAASQYERLRHELEPLREQRLQELQRTREALEMAQAEFMRAMAAAKLPLPEPPPPSRWRRKPVEEEPISPVLVEKSLRIGFASDDEVCGEQGIAPPPSKGNIWNTVGQWLFEFFSPLAAGLLLGVNLGVITGLLSLEVLQRSETLWLVSLAAVIGLFVEKLVGNTAYSLASSAAQASERRQDLAVAEPFPSIRSGGRLAASALLVALLTAAIATVDALGLYMLYQERQHEMQLTGGAVGMQAPLWLFFVVGSIISAPYIVYKTVRGWRDPEIHQREARVAYLQWKHIERRRKEPSVQLAFLKAQEVQNLREHIQVLEEQIRRIEARLDAARMECIGSTQKFCDFWHRLVEWFCAEHEPLHVTSRRNGKQRLYPSGQQGWWSRVWRLFSR